MNLEATSQFRNLLFSLPGSLYLVNNLRQRCPGNAANEEEDNRVDFLRGVRVHCSVRMRKAHYLDALAHV